MRHYEGQIKNVADDYNKLETADGLVKLYYEYK